jgi:hypothetical protein
MSDSIFDRNADFSAWDFTVTAHFGEYVSLNLSIRTSKSRCCHVNPPDCFAWLVEQGGLAFTDVRLVLLRKQFVKGRRETSRLMPKEPIVFGDTSI